MQKSKSENVRIEQLRKDFGDRGDKYNPSYLPAGYKYETDKDDK